MLAISTERANRARANGETAKRLVKQSHKTSQQNGSFKYEVHFETENTYFTAFTKETTALKIQEEILDKKNIRGTPVKR